MAYPAEGRQIRDWECLQCSRSWRESKVRAMLVELHEECFLPAEPERNKQHRAALLSLMNTYLPEKNEEEDDRRSSEQARGNETPKRL